MIFYCSATIFVYKSWRPTIFIRMTKRRGGFMGYSTQFEIGQRPNVGLGEDWENIEHLIYMLYYLSNYKYSKICSNILTKLRTLLGLMLNAQDLLTEQEMEPNNPFRFASFAFHQFPLQRLHFWDLIFRIF